MSLKNKLHHMVYEDEPQKATPPPINLVTPAPVPTNPISWDVHTSAPIPPSQSTVITTDGNTYRILFEATDFETTDAGRILKKHLDPLANVPGLDERTRLQAALAAAKAQDGLTAATVLNAFETLKINLQNKVGAIHSFLDGKTKLEISDRHDKIEALGKQVAELQQQIVQLSTDLAQAQTKINNAQADLNAALAKRGAELDAQKAHYSGLLQ